MRSSYLFIYLVYLSCIKIHALLTQGVLLCTDGRNSCFRRRVNETCAVLGFYAA